MSAHVDRGSPETFLNQSAPAAFICDASATVIWSNEAFGSLFAGHKPPEKLSEFLGQGSARRILGTTHYASFQVEDAIAALAQMKPSAVVIGSAQFDPDRCLRLVFLQSVPSLESGVRERQEYLAAISHDLKNPLGAIFGYADILLDTQAGTGLSERQRELVLRIRSTSLRCVDLVRNYQYLIALKDSPSMQAQCCADLNEVIRAVVDSVWRQSDPAVTLQLDLSPAGLPVRAQRMELERIVANLFGNAIKYTPSPGQIFIRSQKIEGRAALEVRNAPAYIPQAEQARLFECFTRGSTAGEASGTGLGLYIVKTIVERCSGDIVLKSSPEEGTSFSVYLPLGADCAQEASMLKK